MCFVLTGALCSAIVRLVCQAGGRSGALRLIRGNLYRQGWRLAFFRRRMFGPRQAEGPGAILALAFDIVIFGKLRNRRPCPTQLAQLLYDNLGPAVVVLECAMHIDDLIGQLAHVSDISEVSGKDHDSEGAYPKVFAEIEKGYSPTALLDANHLASDALRFPDVVAGLVNAKAFGRTEDRRQRTEGQNRS